MKLVYTHPSSIVVAQARNTLERAGIESTLRNEYASGALGELAPIDTWPELWVIRDRDVERARIALENAHAAVEEADWHCGTCEANSPDTFDFCWRCGKERKYA